MAACIAVKVNHKLDKMPIEPSALQWFVREKVNHVTISFNNVTIPAHKTATFEWWKLLHQTKRITMNSKELIGKWNEQKGKLKQQFAILTDNDLMFAEGKKEEMMGRLQIKLGKSKEELEKIIAEL